MALLSSFVLKSSRLCFRFMFFVVSVVGAVTVVLAVFVAVDPSCPVGRNGNRDKNEIKEIGEKGTLKRVMGWGGGGKGGNN